MKLKYMPDSEGLLYTLLAGGEDSDNIDWQNLDT